MQIECKINQPVAIRRGFNAQSTMILDVDVTTLSDAERAVLADSIVGGRLNPPLSLNEPTPNGLLECLKTEIAMKSKKEALDGKCREIIKEKGTLMQKERLSRGLIAINKEAIRLLTEEIGVPNIAGATLCLDKHIDGASDYILKEILTDREMRLVLEIEKAIPLSNVDIWKIIYEPDSDYVYETPPREKIEAWVTVDREGLELSLYYYIEWN